MKTLILLVIASLAVFPLLAKAEADSSEVFVAAKAELKMVGLELLNSMETEAMMKLWMDFTAQQDQVKNQVPGPFYGVNFYTADYNPKTGEGYGYMAAVEVTDIAELPEGFTSRIIAASDYAVFTHRGQISSIGELYGYIFGEWMQTTTMKPKMQEVFEVYGCDYDPESDDNTVQIWVPIYK